MCMCVTFVVFFSCLLAQHCESRGEQGRLGLQAPVEGHHSVLRQLPLAGIMQDTYDICLDALEGAMYALQVRYIFLQVHYMQ